MDYLRDFYLNSVTVELKKSVPTTSAELIEILLGTFLLQVIGKNSFKNTLTNTTSLSTKELSENDKYETVQNLLFECPDQIIIQTYEEISEIYLGGNNIDTVEGIENLTQLDRYINAIFGNNDIQMCAKETTYLLMYSTMILHDNMKRRKLINLESLSDVQIYNKYFLLLTELIKCTNKDEYDNKLSCFMDFSKFVVNKYTPVEWIKVWIDVVENSSKNIIKPNNDFTQIKKFDHKWTESYDQLVKYVVATSVNQIYSKKFDGAVWTTNNKPIDKSSLLAYMEEINNAFIENNEKIEQMVLDKINSKINSKLNSKLN